MKPHLNSDEFAEHLVIPSAKAQAHLDVCSECRAELDSLARALRYFQTAMHRDAQRPAFFWAAQQTAIRARLADRPKHHGIAWALASTAALAALATAMLFPSSVPHPAQTATSAKTSVQFDQDELLMRDIGESLLSNVADPLEPTNLIAEDLGKSFQQAQSVSK